VLYDQGLTIVHDLGDQRNLRLLEAGVGIPGILWGVLVIGGIIVVAFTYLFGLENTGSHRLMIASLAAIVALAIFTIYALDHPSRALRTFNPNHSSWCWKRSSKNQDKAESRRPRG
jgi:hypothetical protein